MSFENNAFRTVHWKYFLQTVKVKDFNVMIDGRNFFDYSVKYVMRKWKIIWKIATGQGDD